MNTQEQGMDMGFTKEIIPECHHMCLIYDNEEQRREIVSAYLAAGIKGKEIVRYFTDQTSPDQLYAWLAEKGVEFQEDDAFCILPAESAYCPSGSFVPQQVIDNAVARYTTARQAGYTASRVTGEMNWILRGNYSHNLLLEYEVGLNKIRNDFPRVGMCQYDARLFDGAMLFNVLQVHPYMVAQGQIVRNPFYIKPEEFLAKFQRDV